MFRASALDVVMLYVIIIFFKSAMVDEGAKTRQEKTDENLQALLKNNLVEIKENKGA